MSYIKIIRGTYGYKPNGSRILAPKTRNDPPFEVPEAEAKRLVELGVAAYASVQTVAIQPVVPAVVDTQKPEYDASTNANTLKALMKAAGLVMKVGMTKEDMVSALDEFYGVREDHQDEDDGDENEDDEDGEDDDESDDDGTDEDDKPPPLGAEDPVQ